MLQQSQPCSVTCDNTDSAFNKPVLDSVSAGDDSPCLPDIHCQAVRGRAMITAMKDFTARQQRRSQDGDGGLCGVLRTHQPGIPDISCSVSETASPPSSGHGSGCFAAEGKASDAVTNAAGAGDSGSSPEATTTAGNHVAGTVVMQSPVSDTFANMQMHAIHTNGMQDCNGKAASSNGCSMDVVQLDPSNQVASLVAEEHDPLLLLPLQLPCSTNLQQQAIHQHEQQQLPVQVCITHLDMCCVILLFCRATTAKDRNTCLRFDTESMDAYQACALGQRQ